MKISSVVDVFNENMHFDSIKAIDTKNQYCEERNALHKIGKKGRKRYINGKETKSAYFYQEERLRWRRRYCSWGGGEDDPDEAEDDEAGGWCSQVWQLYLSWLLVRVSSIPLIIKNSPV
jgi:hypothetical protein